MGDTSLSPHGMDANHSESHQRLYSAFSPFNDPLDLTQQAASPMLQRQQFAHPGPPSVAGISDGPSPASSDVHRMSFSGQQYGVRQVAHNSIDGSDYNSPTSIFGTNRVGGTPTRTEDKTSAYNGADNGKVTDPKDEGPDAPSWAELKTKAGKDRKRLPLACITCRRKKIRCSGEKPACKHCLRSRIPCVYKVTTRKAAPRTDYMAMLDKRLKRMEERVIKIMPKDDHQRNVDAIGRAVVKPALPGAPQKETKKRAAAEAFGDELDSWSKTKATKGGAKATTKPEDAAREDLMTEGVEHLPSVEIQHHLAEVFFDYVYGQTYHLLHKPSYMRRLEAGQLPPVLNLSVCALAARFSTHPELRTEPAFMRGEDWAKPAREIALKRYDRPNITILICYLLLGLHEFGNCQGGRSWMLGGMAQRMAYALQLHKDLDHSAPSGTQDDGSDLTFTDREVRRRTMWACFIMDRFNSSGTDRPLFVAESYIEAQLPIREQYFQMEITGPTEKLDGGVSKTVEPDSGQVSDPKSNMGVAAYMVRAVAIWGQVVRYINLGGREKDPHPMWSDESGFAKLRASMAEFKANLPATLAWNEENLRNHATVKTGNQFIFLHIIYHQNNLFMNRFALPVTGQRTMSTNEMPPSFLSECARTALDAANQISSLVNQAHDYRVVAAFAGYSAFLSSTVHIHGLSSKNPAIEAASKQYLAWNVKYLSQMKKYWGMFHFVTEHLKDLYRRQVDAGVRAQQGTATPAGAKPNEVIFQYGDWFDRYPHGVSGADYEETGTNIKMEKGADVLFGQKADLQSVEEFFQKLSPQTRAAQVRKMSKKKKAAAANADAGEDSTGKRTARPQLGREVSQTSVGTTDQTNDFTGQFDPAQAGMYDMTPDLALLQAQQQHFSQMQQPGMMAQLDRQMVLNSYQGAQGNPLHTIDPATFPDMLTDPSFAGFENMTVPEGMDWTEPSSLSWFMPFNVDPPNNMGDDASLFGGQYDFGGMIGMGGGYADMNMGDGMGEGNNNNNGV